MSRWQAENIGVDIGARSIVLQRGARRSALNAAGGDWAALGAELAQALPARARLSVRVADRWSRTFLLEAPGGIASLRDCRLLLDARFEALYGQAPADWLLQADWQAGAPMLACAIPRALRQALAGFALARLQPALLHDWNRHCAALPADGVWCAAADGVVNLLVWHKARLQLVRQQPGTDVEGLLALEMARLGMALPAARFWSGPAAPAGWTPLEAAA
ncbi:hypothetical protein HF313_13035 [Massilia atriviolacea]|uniref:Pilus assembly protein PilM n=1 Tax=Massilia atriviolacea TaxID=2495579 RepID=A0A430HQ78_9BURK|nr:hypothetical protein [Massilia atriviolacea]RSZ59670.1 hypothetical protein EJB06_05585 [Massilia atriviolacea]